MMKQLLVNRLRKAHELSTRVSSRRTQQLASKYRVIGMVTVVFCLEHLRKNFLNEENDGRGRVAGEC